MVRSIANRTFFFLLLIVASCQSSGMTVAGEPAERTYSAEDQLRQALLSKDAEELRALLAESSKIYLSLATMKEAKGFFSVDQTVLIFKEFLSGVSVLDLRLESASSEPSSLFITASLTFKDRYAKISSIVLAFTWIQEKGSWKIKEIRESGS